MKLEAFMGPDFRPSSGSIKIPIGGLIEDYRTRYEALSKRAKFFHQVYTVNPGARLIIHVKVPSESLSKDLDHQAQAPIYYDVLLELNPGGSLKYEDCDVKVFSNSPSFVYQAAYVFAHWDPEGRASSGKDRMMVDSMKGRVPKNSMFISGLSQKLGPEPTHDKPVIRNPMGIPMFDKSIYYAIFYLKDKLPLQEALKVHNNVTIQQVSSVIMNFDRLMAERKRQERRFKERHARSHKSDAATTKKVEADIARRATGMNAPIKPKRATSITGNGTKIRKMSTTKTTRRISESATKK